MKKLLVVTLVTILCLSITGIAFAAVRLGPISAGANYQSTPIGSSLYSPSTNVTVSILSSATAYCAAAQHLSSTTSAGRQYYTTSADPATREAAGEATTATAGPKNCASVNAY